MPNPKVNTSAERDRVKPRLKDEVNGASGTPVELPTAFLSEFRRFAANLAERSARFRLYRFDGPSSAAEFDELRPGLHLGGLAR
jgi:hypothetical protein